MRGSIPPPITRAWKVSRPFFFARIPTRREVSSVCPAGSREVEHRAFKGLARLSGLSGLVPSVDWLLCIAIRKEALRTSEIEGSQATLTDLFDGLPFSVRPLCEAHGVLAGRGTWCRQATRGAAAFPELDRWHPSGQRRLRAVARVAELLGDLE
ncbi:MAG: Fic/DOC family N-terminal domain-containing protein [Pseudomonadales bacterium]